MSAKQYKNRKEVPAKYKWDLEDVLKGKSFEDLIKEHEKIFAQLVKTKESRYENKESFLKALKLEDKATLLFNRIYNYVSNNVSANVVDQKANERQVTLSNYFYKLNTMMGPELPVIMKNEVKIKKYLKDPRFKVYRRDYEQVWENKKHQLSKAVQEYRTIASKGDMSTQPLFSILTNSELDYGYAVSKTGRKIKISTANYSKLMESKDENIRKTASINYKKAFTRHKESLANMLYQTFRSHVVSSQVRKYNGIIDYLVADDKSSDKLLQSLYGAVKDNLDVFKSYSNLHKKVYKAKYKKTMGKYDGALPLVSVKTDYSIEEMQKEVLKAFKPFGKEYTDQVKVAFKERWVDYMSIDNKRGGAYSIGASHGLDKKYILMNNTGDIRSVETLAHEMGHSMHSYYSDNNNHVRESSYKIFVAEIASIFNELMLFDHLLNTTDDDKLKFKIRQQMATGFAGTVHRQTLWSNFEYKLFKAIEEDKPVSNYGAIAKIYYDNEIEYSTKKNPRPFKEDEQYNAVRIPHFYSPFYVYKYAIGQLVANIFFQRYKVEGPKALQDYINNFLKMGGSLDNLDLLKHNGIDLEDINTYNIGFDAARDNVKELRKLAKKLFKI